MASLVTQTVKKSVCKAGDMSSILGSGRFPGEGNGYPLQYSCLKNPMDRRTWQATVHGVTKGQTQPSNYHSLMYLWLKNQVFYRTCALPLTWPLHLILSSKHYVFHSSFRVFLRDQWLLLQSQCSSPPLSLWPLSALLFLCAILDQLW